MATEGYDPIDPAVRREIETRLDAVEATDGVRPLMAIESGSRAWGFPSPESDYDVRFLYVRPRDWYLSLVPGRDVIQHEIVDEIDPNGWDVRKAFGLADSRRTRSRGSLARAQDACSLRRSRD